MKISKTFSMTVSGKYQSYTFSTMLEAEGSAETGDEEANALFDLAKNATFADIETLAENDEEFRTVLGARREELANYRKVLDGKALAAKNSVGKFRPHKLE